ncbi:MAG: methylmalonyl Co-A mutase-associated GTPase MeaB [Anaerolineales bacterium]|nr:methylmalonyl Co-A mutase-associated GTPase MeaB [Anaerolineales bacterium]
MDLVRSVLSGDRLALARLLSQVESGDQAGVEALNALFPHTGGGQLIGVTGAPGTGKSSLVNQLALHYRQPPGGEPRRVAILAVDPSSPFTGGAVLGDRIRMRELSGDEGVFIRSMASRGSLGGLAAASAGAVQAFDAAGYDIILIETVGSGQSEVEIAKLAHTTLVVDVPGLGDDVQAIKAGILEIADILVLNKADRPGVESAERALQGMLKLGHPTKRVMHHGRTEDVAAAKGEQAAADEWIPPIRRTVATEGKGIVELAMSIEGHRQFLESSGEWRGRERARLQNEVELLLQGELMSAWRSRVSPAQYEAALDALVERKQSPRQAVAALLNGHGGKA